MTTHLKMTADKALSLLCRPGAKLVRLHASNSTAGFYIWPRGGRISNEIAQALLERNDVQPYENGLLPGHPQSWRLGDWRKQAQP
jgi:hypothetical protein